MCSLQDHKLSEWGTPERRVRACRYASSRRMRKPTCRSKSTDCEKQMHTVQGEAKALSRDVLERLTTLEGVGGYPPLDPDSIVGKMKFTKGNIDWGYFWYTDFWVPNPSPLLSSTTSLVLPMADLPDLLSASGNTCRRQQQMDFADRRVQHAALYSSSTSPTRHSPSCQHVQVGNTNNSPMFCTCHRDRQEPPPAHVVTTMVDQYRGRPALRIPVRIPGRYQGYVREGVIRGGPSPILMQGATGGEGGFHLGTISAGKIS